MDAYSNMDIIGAPSQGAVGSMEDNTGQNMNKEHWNTEISSPSISWSDSTVRKNVMAESGIETCTS